VRTKTHREESGRLICEVLTQLHIRGKINQFRVEWGSRYPYVEVDGEVLIGEKRE
jgi:hypothetical protein